MKSILILGKNSYIGNALREWLLKSPEEFAVEAISQRDDAWKDADFSRFDAVVDCVGIAHVDSGAASKERALEYDSVNTQLAADTARKAKAEGVRQFIYLSSSIVYGGQKHISRETQPKPLNAYSASKLNAEKELQKLESGDFRVAILRLPMVYGADCRGNYPRLASLAKKTLVFPYVENRRSMLYIENLCCFLALMIRNEESGLFWPQNAEYTCTSEMVQAIAKAHGRKIWLVPGLKPLFRFAGLFSSVPDKVFGDLYYDRDMSAYREDYQVCGLEESIRRTERI
ncbi:MAG: NAD-dependent epimerase/dehydratase family protein [Oscillospiraceae bacterium]|nr:NAD-dependent epimerase/dehydratase family protein [Oscillospiraceae bacterium]